MTAERKSDNLSKALFFVSGFCLGAAGGLGAAELIKKPSIIKNFSKKVFPKSAQKRKAA